MKSESSSGTQSRTDTKTTTTPVKSVKCVKSEKNAAITPESSLVSSRCVTKKKNHIPQVESPLLRDITPLKFSQSPLLKDISPLKVSQSPLLRDIAPLKVSQQRGAENLCSVLSGDNPFDTPKPRQPTGKQQPQQQQKPQQQTMYYGVTETPQPSSKSSSLSGTKQQQTPTRLLDMDDSLWCTTPQFTGTGNLLTPSVASHRDRDGDSDENTLDNIDSLRFFESLQDSDSEL